MSHYIDTQNKLHFLEDDDFAHILPVGSTLLSDEEYAEIINAPEPAEKIIARKQAELDALEASLFMTRGEREGWLVMMVSQATAQNTTLETLYKSNQFFKKLKDADDKASALRAEIKAIS